MIRLPEIKTAELSTYGNFAKCHQAHFRVSCVGLGTRLFPLGVSAKPGDWTLDWTLDWILDWILDLTSYACAHSWHHGYYTPGRGKIVPRKYYTPGIGKIVPRNII